MDDPGLELKYAGGLPLQAETGAQGCVIEGYASLFGIADQGGDVIAAGAYAGSLARIAARGDRVRMLWQHDPAHPIGVWEEIREDSRGLWVRGRLLPEVARAREAAALVAAGAIDGLSIGYRTRRAEKAAAGRLLHEIELWEVSLVTFPMLAEARGQTAAASEAEDLARALAATFREAREMLA